MPVPTGRDMSTVRALMIAPGAGVLGDALALQLAAHGFTLVDRTSETSFVVRTDISEREVMQPASIAALRSSGVDAIVFVRTVAGYDDLPQSATARVIATADGALIGGATWQNGHSGQQGSVADRRMRGDIGDAAHDLANAIAKEFHRQ